MDLDGLGWGSLGEVGWGSFGWLHGLDLGESGWISFGMVLDGLVWTGKR